MPSTVQFQNSISFKKWVKNRLTQKIEFQMLQASLNNNPGSKQYCL